MIFGRRDNGYYVADDAGNVYGLMMNLFGGWVVMRNERAVGSAPDLNGAIREAHHVKERCGS